MRCIFCKNPSQSSNSVEHIIPESLGNAEHMLPKGVVCDACNNYFALKVEKPVLNSPMMMLLRCDMKIPNKRSRIPEFDPNQPADLPEYRLMSRFLAKAAIEALAFKTRHVPGSATEIVEKTELDELRSYARFDRGNTWPFVYRTLYPVNSVFREGSICYELLHEFDVFYTDNWELYFVVAIFGVEFVINLGGREFGGYEKWLEEHHFASPLYKNMTCKIKE